MSAAVKHLFVYGLLMRGFRLHALLDEGEFAGEATIEGRLVSLGDYPGLLEQPGTVCGELYRFDEIDPALAVLDPAEGFRPEDPDAGLYRRVTRAVRLDGVRDLSAWVYVFNRPTADVVRIPSGDWRKFIADRGT